MYLFRKKLWKFFVLIVGVNNNCKIEMFTFCINLLQMILTINYKLNNAHQFIVDLNKCTDIICTQLQWVLIQD